MNDSGSWVNFVQIIPFILLLIVIYKRQTKAFFDIILKAS